MTKLLRLTAICMLLAVLSHNFSLQDDDHTGYLRKERLFWFLLGIVMVCFAGLRIHYNDTDTYVHAYNLLAASPDPFSGFQWTLGMNPGFTLCNILLAKLGFSAQSFLFAYSVLTVGISLWFIRKYTNNVWLSVFLYIVVGNYIFTLAAIKQCAAIAFCLVGIDRALRKKWISFTFWVLLGTVFHPYALLYFLTPLLMFRPWSGKTYLMLILFIAAGLLLQPLIGTVINITTLLGEEYDADSFMGEGVNPFRFAVMAVPILLSFLSRAVIREENNRTNNLILNLSMLNGTIMFVALFGTANYFARLANYFVIFQSLAIPWLLTHFEPRSRKILTRTAVVCYALYFYYENGVTLPFDHYYYATTLGKYLKTLF